jgi:hypothetical protein
MCRDCQAQGLYNVSGWPRLLLKNSLHDASADAELLANLEDAITIGSKLKYARLHRRLNPTPAQFRAVCLSASETGVYPFPNDPPLELGEYAKHLKHRLARGRRSIESLLVKEQANTLFVEPLEYAEQIGERSTQPIH